MELFDQAIERRPVASTFFHFLNWILQHRHLCDNILLEHEGDCPAWVVDYARQMIDIYDEAASWIET